MKLLEEGEISKMLFSGKKKLIWGKIKVSGSYFIEVVLESENPFY